MKTMLLCLVGVTVALSAKTLIGAAAATAPDLTGQISREDGSPLSNATIFIYTAGPRVGTASLCPSCYPDCRKSAQTDKAGRFQINALDPKLLFRLLVVAPGCDAKFVSKVDPAAEPVQIVLRETDQDALQSKSRVGGMVIGPEGQPLIGAVLNIEGLERGSSTRWGGNDRDVDPIAVTDDKGRFSLRCAQGVDAIHARAECRGVAKHWVRMTPGQDHLIRMEDGVMVSGRVLRQGQAVRGAVVGVITANLEAGKGLSDFESTTDGNGRFAIECVTPNLVYNLYCKMDSLEGHGALPPKSLKVSATGTVFDVGELEIKPGFRVAGRIVLSDHKPIPPDTRIVLGREEAYDHAEVILRPDGSFEFLGVPPEPVSLGVRIPGYRFSKGNPSLDWYNGIIVGRIEGNLTGLNLLMETGRWQPSRGDEDDGAPPDLDRQPRNKPLRGSPDQSGF